MAVIGCGLAFGLAALPRPARAAEAYPSRPITIVVPFGAGSGTDIATVIAQPLCAALDQNIVVDHRPGANGGIAATYVAKAAPDGYTLLMSTNSPHSSNPALLKNLTYDPVRDFAPITRICSFTLMLVVNPAVPVKTLAELIAYAEANPGHLALRPLGITRPRRSMLLSDLPTFHESGLKDFEVESWAGLFAPAATDPAIVARLNTETRAIVENPRIKSAASDSRRREQRDLRAK